MTQKENIEKLYPISSKYPISLIYFLLKHPVQLLKEKVTFFLNIFSRLSALVIFKL